MSAVSVLLVGRDESWKAAYVAGNLFSFSCLSALLSFYLPSPSLSLTPSLLFVNDLAKIFSNPPPFHRIIIEKLDKDEVHRRFRLDWDTWFCTPPLLLTVNGALFLPALELGRGSTANGIATGTTHVWSWSISSSRRPNAIFTQLPISFCIRSQLRR